MNNQPGFKRIALMGRQRGTAINETLLALKTFLRSRQADVVFEQETAALLSQQNKPAIPADELGKHCDLIIAVGGDGSLLKAAHVAVQQKLPVLGINRGRLGFLTDIRPEEFSKVSAVLDGNYWEEQRFLLTASLYDHEQQLIKQIKSRYGDKNKNNKFSVGVKKGNQRWVEIAQEGGDKPTPVSETSGGQQRVSEQNRIAKVEVSRAKLDALAEDMKF